MTCTHDFQGRRILWMASERAVSAAGRRKEAIPAAQIFPSVFLDGPGAMVAGSV